MSYTPGGAIPESLPDGSIPGAKLIVSGSGGTDKYLAVGADGSLSASTVASSGVPNPQGNGALAILKAYLAARNSAPVVVGFIGSSTTAGQQASTAGKRWVNRFYARLAAMFPPDTGTHNGVVTSVPSTPANGITFVNLGVGGHYTNSISQATCESLGSKNPAAVFHQCGMNDYANGAIAPATTKTNVLTRMNWINNAASRPVAHIFISTYPRWDFTPSTGKLYADYIAKYKEICQEYPNNTYLMQFEDDFAKVGVGYGSGSPPPDYLDLVIYDNVHMNDAGHLYLSELIVSRLGFNMPSGGGGEGTGPVDVTSPTAPSSFAIGNPTSSTAPCSWTNGTDDVAIDFTRVFYRAPSGSGSWQSKDVSFPATSTTITGLPSSTTLEAYAVHYDTSGNPSSPSNTDTDTTAASGGAGSDVEIIATAIAPRLTSGDVINVDINIPSGHTNRHLVAILANSHDQSSWVNWPSYDTISVVSNIDGAMERPTGAFGDEDPIRSTGPTGQRCGSVSMWELDNPSVGTHTITGTIADGGSSNTELFLVVIALANCDGLANGQIGGGDSSTTSVPQMDVSSAPGEYVLYALQASQNINGTGTLSGATSSALPYKDGASVSGYGDYLGVAMVPGDTSVALTASLAASGVHSRLAANCIKVPVPDTTPPSKPANFTIGTTTTSTAPCSWTASTDDVGVDHYIVFYRSPAGTGSWQQTSPVYGTSTTITGLASNTTVEAYVVAYDLAGNASTPSDTDDSVTDSAGGPITVIAQGSNRITGNNDNVTASITVPSGSNKRLYAVMANSHSDWVNNWNDYDTKGVVSSIDGAFTLINIGGTNACRNNGPSGQRSGSISVWSLGTVSEGTHTITGTIADGGSNNAHMMLYVFAVDNCSGEAQLTVTGNDSTASSTSTGPLTSATGNMALYVHLSSQNPTLTGGGTQLHKDGAAVSGYGDYFLIANAAGSSSVGPFTVSHATSATNSRILLELLNAT